MKKTLQLLIIVILILGAPKVYAQNAVEKQVLIIGLFLDDKGYELTHNIEFANLRNGSYDDYYFTLERWNDYQIFSVCDGDCGDIDLRLYDENNNLVASDTKADDTPAVAISPKWTGRFRLRVTMYNCRYNPCKFGLAVFGK